MAASKKATTPKKTASKRTASHPPKKNVKNTAKKAEDGQQKQLTALILFAAGLLLVAMALISGQNIWKKAHEVLFGIFGGAAYFFGFFILMSAFLVAMGRTSGKPKNKVWQIGILFWLICAEIQIAVLSSSGGGSMTSEIGRAFTEGTHGAGGGLFGALIGVPFTYAFGKTAALVVVGVCIFVFAFLITGVTLKDCLSVLSSSARQMESEVKQYSKRQHEDGRSAAKIDVPLDGLPAHPVSSRKFCVPALEESNTKKARKEKAVRGASTTEKQELIPIQNVKTPQQIDELVQRAVESEKAEQAATGSVRMEQKRSDYQIPPAQLLRQVSGNGNRDVSGELRENADRLVDTLRSFGVETRIVNICRGPSVTRYELQPSAGVKISKITNLADDIALSLAAGGVRIEAPIPNKPAVGIEVPNKHKDIVTLREVVESREFTQAKSYLTFSLGRDIAGNIAITDIARMPHLLIAGATGSGKSVCINSLIISLLYKAPPEEVRLLMIDPKVVELGVYNGIPHLLVPVVTDPRKAAGALGWAVTEMLNRYKLFAQTGVRDLKGFNQIAAQGKRDDNGELLTPMPQIVIIIDELADLMMAASREVEDSICRLAQMARAAGMHLVIATQRPSVDVITGVIKANIPSRIAFTVSSQVDSRTILDGSGAEKLLGKGDMLFHPMDQQKPVRIQGCFVSDKEVEEVVSYIKSQEDADYSEDILEEIEKKAAEETSDNRGKESDEYDSMLPAAVEVVLDAGQASTSFLQRRLKVGYARAARIMDEMEEQGFVGPQEGSKSREIRITKQQWLEMSLAQSAKEEAEQRHG